VFFRLLKRVNPWSSLAGLPTLVWWIALASFVNRAGCMVLPFLLLYLTRHLGWQPSDAAWILFLYGVCSMIAGPLAGRLCDRFGCGKILCISLAGSSCVLLIFPLAKSLPAVAFATVLLSFASESFRPASLAIQAHVLKPELRVRGFTLNRLAVNAGMSIGPALGGLLASIWFPAIFLIDGLSALVASVLLARFVWSQGARKESSEEASFAPTTDRRYLFLLAGAFLITLGFFQIESALALTVVDGLGLSEREFGLIFTVNTVFILLFEVAINHRTSAWKPSRALMFGAILLGLGLGGTAIVEDLRGLLLMTLVWTVGEIMFFPAQLARIADIAPEDRMGAYMGLMTSCCGLSFAVAPLIGVPLYSWLGQFHFWPLVFLICVVGGLLSSRS
jgi:predicted MFS family arabinose efflux permease